MNETTTAFLAGVPVEVDPLKIERELAALWKPASDLQGGEGAVVRSCMSNLVAYLPEPEAWEPSRKLFQEVSSHHPVRLILLEVGDLPPGARGGETRSRLGASVTANCFSPRAGVAPVCCEQITLRSEPADVGLLPEAVTPLLVPDIPVYLWWSGPSDLDLLLELAANVDRVIINSCCDVPGQGRLGDLVRLARHERIRELVDLGWRGLGRWREAIAKAFDAPALRPLLSSPGVIQVEWAVPEGETPRPGDEEEAALLLGWFISRLRLEPGTSGKSAPGLREREFRDRAGDPVTVASAALEVKEAARLRRGEVLSVTLRGRDDEEKSWVRFELARDGSGTLRLNWETPRECLLSRVLPFGRPDPVELLEEILNTPPHPHIFREALDAGARFVEDATS